MKNGSKMPKYVPIGRKFLFVDKKVKKSYKRYKKDIGSIATVVCRRGGIRDKVVEGEEIFVPMYVIACNPCVDYAKEKINKKDLKKSGKKAIEKSEDTEVFSTLEASLREDHTIKVCGDVTLIGLMEVFSLLEKNGHHPKNILINPKQISDFRLYGGDVFIENSPKKYKKTSILGKFMNAKVYVSTRAKEDLVFVLARPKEVGVFAERTSIQYEKQKDVKSLRKGYVMWESIGVCVSNHNAVAALQLVKQ